MENLISKININENIKNIKLDIGLSYNAPQSQSWLEKEKDLLVIGFEPDPESVENILKKDIIKKHSFHGTPIKNEYINTQFFIIPCALGNVIEKKELDFYKMENDCGTSSLFKPTNILGPIKKIIKVPVYSLKHFFDLFPWWNRFEYIDYIKIDAQGSDLDILKGAGYYLKEKVVYITAEPETIAYEQCNNNTTQNITNYLLSQNFIKINHPNTIDPTFINQKFYHLKDKIFINQT